MILSSSVESWVPAFGPTMRGRANEAYHPTLPPPRLHGITVNGRCCPVLAVVPDYGLAGGRGQLVSIANGAKHTDRWRPSNVAGC
jgi:hypothetical protein